ncbi:MAG: sigma-70 family RNA polymerase sigma factor [Thermoleophilaceae bacterium]
MLSTQSDERLVDLVRAGSDPAFEAIVERYRRALMRYVSRLLPPERAEDVVQQSFVKAYEAMHKGSAELNLRPWLYRIAHNGALNALRDRGASHAQLSDTIDGVERPDQAFERKHGLRDLVVSVQALPERQRSAILLREMEGRSYEEIAAALGVSDGAVRQLLHRARNTLRAAAASVIPMPLVERVAAYASSDPMSSRVAELVGVGSGALAMKVCSTALVTGAVVGGAAIVPSGGRDHTRDGTGGVAAAQAAEASGDASSASRSADSGRSGTGSRGGGERSGRDASGDRSRGDGSPSGGTGGGRRSGSGERGGELGDDGSGERGGGGERGDDDGGRSGGGRTRRGDDGGGSEPDGGGLPDGHGSLPDDDPISEPTHARDDPTEPDGGGGNSGPGGGTDDLPEPEPLDGSGMPDN